MPQGKVLLPQQGQNPPGSQPKPPSHVGTRICVRALGNSRTQCSSGDPTWISSIPLPSTLFQE